MKLRMLSIFVVIALLSLALPATAGRYKLVYEAKGQVSVSIFEDKLGREKILFRGLPLTGDRTPGPAVIRLNGVYIAQWANPSYEFEFDLNAGRLPSLEGELVIPWLKSDPNQSLDLARLTIGVNTVELFFASKDGKGKLDRNHTAAPATQFRVEEVDPPQAAVSSGGAPLSPDQLDAAIKQSYEQGAEAGKAAWQKEREQLLQELQKATDELNELRRKSAVGSERPAVMPLAKRYLPISWKQEDWPTANDQMVLVDPNGRAIAQAQIVELFPKESRVWVAVTIPIDLVDLKGYTVQRSKDRKEGK